MPLLFTGNVDIEARDYHISRTPLLWAVTNGEIIVVDRLLDNDSYIHAGDIFEVDSLQYAVFSNQEKMEALLLEKGALLDDLFGLQAMFGSS